MISKPFVKPPTGFWDIMIPVKGRVTISIILSAISSAAGLASLLAIPPIAYELLSSTPNVNRIELWVAASAFAVVIAFTTRVWAFRVSHMAAFQLEVLLRTALAEHLAQVSLGYVVTMGSGAIKKIVQDDVKALHAFVADSMPLFGRAFTAPVLTLIVLFAVDWRMALASIIITPIGIALIHFAMRDHAERRLEYDEANERINMAVIEFVQGMQVVRTFDDGTTSFARYRHTLDKFTCKLKDWMAATIIPARLGILVLATLPALLSITTVGVWLLMQGTLDFPTLLLFLLLAAGVNEAIMPIIHLTHFINDSRAGALRIAEVLAEPSLPQPSQAQQPIDTSIRLRNVTFSYNNCKVSPEENRSALQDVSIEIKAGTVTALVGPSGAGKTTIARLIPRFWDVEKGSVEIGGVDVREMTSDTLMSWVSFVFQDTFLLYDTIRENIRLGRPDATDEEIEAAARAAGAHDFILELPNSYDTVAGERGSRLSGGQRQRITIARAILQDNPIVVLDEATAFADPENEALIQEAIATLTAGKTLVVVAHRLSTIRDVDQIIVLDQGRVVERANHDQLIAANGLYTRLWENHQRAQNWELRAHSAEVVSS